MTDVTRRGGGWTIGWESSAGVERARCLMHDRAGRDFGGTPKSARGPRALPSPRWRLQITDDGRGFDVRAVNGKGRGLTNLAARAAELGGRCDIQSAPGSGTRVVIEFPA